MSRVAFPNSFPADRVEIGVEIDSEVVLRRWASVLNQRTVTPTIHSARVSAKKGIESASRIVLMNVISIRLSSHESDTVS
jgi:hypothetical protein